MNSVPARMFYVTNGGINKEGAINKKDLYLYVYNALKYIEHVVVIM